MLRNVHLATEDDDDMYGGFNEYDPSYDVEGLEDDEGFKQAVRTSHGNRPPLPTNAMKLAVGGAPKRTSGATGTSAGGALRSRGLGSQMGRPATGSDGGAPRPMTAIVAAGFQTSSSRSGSQERTGVSMQAASVPASVDAKSEENPEEVIKQLEKKVIELLEESAFANSKGNLQLALDRGKEAGRKERLLCKQREQNSLSEQINLDLTYSVLFNLAVQYEANEMYVEATNTYLVIVKNKMFSNAGRLRVNMGNIYLKQKKYMQAVKMYRMALDQVSTSHELIRAKILQNIGLVFVKMGQYSDAVTSYEHIMANSKKPDFKTAFNLILCYFALGERDKMKQTFQRMLQANLELGDEDRYYVTTDDPHSMLVHEAIKDDKLRQIERERKQMAERCIVTAAKIIAPSVEASFAAGFDWCVECVRLSPYSDLAGELEITKAITYLKMKDFQTAIDVLKGFEKKESNMASAAATNLSFMFVLENDLGQAEKYAEMAMASDRYNPLALVNRGNCSFMKKEWERAAEFYQEALQVDSSCTEALYNLGLLYKKLSRLEEALECFLKLHAILRNSSQVMYQIAHVYELMMDVTNATEWFMQLVSVVPTDPAILSRLGDLYDSTQDKSQAFQYQYESFRYFPSNIDVISWLGAYYVDSQFCEKAIVFFERAAVIQPNEVKWQLMVASCHRRTGNYQQAFQTYKQIHQCFPENVECLKFLVRLCNDLGLKELQEYAGKLKKAEKAKEQREQRAKSDGRRGSGTRSGSKTRSRNTSAGSGVSQDRYVILVLC
jgi:intraflagellar transport protein 88